jgi:hypothetical protein
MRPFMMGTIAHQPNAHHGHPAKFHQSDRPSAPRARTTKITILPGQQRDRGAKALIIMMGIDGSTLAVKKELGFK